MTKEHMIDLLPYYLQDGKNINIYYKVLADMYDDLLNTFLDIIENRDLDAADLYALDIIGGIVGQRRNSSDNEIYRNRIKTRVIQNNSRGYIDDINELAQIFLGDVFLGINQGWHSEHLGYEPALLEIVLRDNVANDSLEGNIGRTIKVGTTKTGINKLGSSLKSFPTEKPIYTYKHIVISDLKQAIPIGVNLKYLIKNTEDVIKIKESNKIKINSSVREVSIKENVKINYTSILECGINECSAQIGTLL